MSVLPLSVLLGAYAYQFSLQLLSKCWTRCRGIQLVYLPPYSPDYNPIEQGFSATKAWLKRHGEVMRAALESRDPQEAASVYAEAIYSSMTPDKISGWFSHCGY